MSERGVYRSIYSALVDDPDFQGLPAKARLVLLTARICKQAGPIGIFRYYHVLLREQSGLSMKEVEPALVALEAADWIRREGPILWIRNALRHDPSMHLKNKKHLHAITEWLKELPRLQIVLDFCHYYEIAKPFDSLSDSHSDASRYIGRLKTEDRRLKTEDRKKQPLPPAPDAPEPGATGQWGQPQDLVELYNRLAPPGLARVTRLSTARRDKAAQYLKQFPEQEFWIRCFSELKFSKLLLGLKPSPGHEHFRGEFDWILSKGSKDQIENCLKVVEGKYHDAEERR